MALSTLPHSAFPLLFPSFAKVVHILGPKNREVNFGSMLFKNTISNLNDKLYFIQFYFTCKVWCQYIFWRNVDYDNAINDYHAAYDTHHHCTKQGKTKSLFASLWRIKYFRHFGDSLLIRTCLIDGNDVFCNLIPKNQQTFQLVWYNRKFQYCNSIVFLPLKGIV